MKRKKEIKAKIESLGIEKSYIATALNIPLQTFLYLLDEEKELDKDLYNQIIEIINKHEPIFDFIEEERDDNYSLFKEEEKIRISIGERIRLFGKQKYGTLTRLSQNMEISPQQLQQYVSGKREPGARILIKLLKLGCNINWLLGNSEPFESYKIYKLEQEIKKLQNTLSQIGSLINDTNTNKKK